MSEETRTFDDGAVELAPRTGTSFVVKKGQRLIVIDPQGGQVGDLVAFKEADPNETLSNGRTFDYNDKIYQTVGDPLFSNRSNVMLRIVEDTVGRHDMLLTACSTETFRVVYGDKYPLPGCFGNLAHALARHGINADQIPTPFNCFMNVPVDGETGKFKIHPPPSKAGDHVDFVAEMDLIIGLTACSAPKTNNYTFKPIQYRIEG